LFYFYVVRYNPLLAKAGKNPFILDSPAPSGDLKEFLYKEVRFIFFYFFDILFRYEALTRQFREEAERLHALLIEDKQKEYERYKAMAEQK
jgi:pyruvate-ferredoxin/flavodoxin oxidoreductase